MEHNKIGYLNHEFRIFHLFDREQKEFDLHYHDFHKIIIFISGNVSYFIEGRSYQLKPYDIVIVRAGEIHRPVIHDRSMYERFVIYISSKFFDAYKTSDYDLEYCFMQSKKFQTNVLRIEDEKRSIIQDSTNRLKTAMDMKGYASELHEKILFIEFIILVNQIIYERNNYYLESTISNKKIIDILNYMNENIASDITVDDIASNFYMNRSYLMHLFKAETGYTIGKYITEKRLFLAKSLIHNGSSLTDACYESGFKNYATFYRAFKEKFGKSPKDASDIF